VFFRWLCGIPASVGLTATVRYPVRDAAGRLVRLEGESRRLLRLIEPEAGLRRRDAERISVPADASRRGADALRDAGLADRRLIAFAPGSKMPAKLWPEERYAAVGQELLKRWPDVGIVVLGSAEERPIGDRLCAVWGGASVNLMGRLRVWEAAGVLERCALYVGNDTGTMHLAAAVGVDCVAIFSARDNPGRWEPEGSRHVIFRHDLPCGGCQLIECVLEDRACLKAIEWQAVAAAVTARLDGVIECSTLPSRVSAG
jgi:ADP-heptose:LPS heptosyltransferase